MASSTPEISGAEDRLYEIGQACEEHLDRCMDSEFLDLEDTGDSPAFAPFCGCNTCVVREVLMTAWPLFLKYMETSSDSGSD